VPKLNVSGLTCAIVVANGLAGAGTGARTQEPQTATGDWVRVRETCPTPESVTGFLNALPFPLAREAEITAAVDGEAVRFQIGLRRLVQKSIGRTSLSGVATDESGAAQPGVLVLLVRYQGPALIGISRTNESGAYAFAEVDPGTYYVSLGDLGWRGTVLGEVRLLAGMPRVLPTTRLRPAPPPPQPPPQTVVHQTIHVGAISQKWRLGQLPSAEALREWLASHKAASETTAGTWRALYSPATPSDIKTVLITLPGPPAREIGYVWYWSWE
jgi:hypothetical protein